MILKEMYCFLIAFKLNAFEASHNVYKNAHEFIQVRNIIQTHINGLWDWQYYAEYSHIKSKWWNIL